MIFNQSFEATFKPRRIKKKTNIWFLDNGMLMDIIISWCSGKTRSSRSYEICVVRWCRQAKLLEGDDRQVIEDHRRSDQLMLEWGHLLLPQKGAKMSSLEKCQSFVNTRSQWRLRLVPEKGKRKLPTSQLFRLFVQKMKLICWLFRKFWKTIPMFGDCASYPRRCRVKRRTECLQGQRQKHTESAWCSASWHTTLIKKKKQLNCDYSLLVNVQSLFSIVHTKTKSTSMKFVFVAACRLNFETRSANVCPGQNFVPGSFINKKCKVRSTHLLWKTDHG